jgi:hypothetical protein
MYLLSDSAVACEYLEHIDRLMSPPADFVSIYCGVRVLGMPTNLIISVVAAGVTLSLVAD